MLVKQKEAEYRDNQIGIDFITCPSQECIYRTIQSSGSLLVEKFYLQNISPTHSCTSRNTQLHILQIHASRRLESLVELVAIAESKRTQIIQLLVLFNINRESITQTVSPVLIKNQDGATVNRFYFSFPIDLQLIAKTKSAELEWPTLHYQVFEKDNWDRIFFQGCGFVQVPSSQGSYVLQSQTWKPNLDYRTKVF